MADSSNREQDPVAIIGIGCRFPGASSPLAFWHLLLEGRDALTEVPKDRFDIDAYFDPTPGKPGKIVTRRGGFLDSISDFDASFFGISPREAAHMDPQQRLLLEVSWEALEDAGLVLGDLAGSHTGVFVGLISADYQELMQRHIQDLDAIAATGGSRNAAAGRMSYLLGLRGPSLVIDSDRSSSLVAIHLACQSIRRGECSTALAAGSNLILTPHSSIAFSRSMMISPTGTCRFCDAAADGFVRSEGVGVVILKPLSAALEAGDPVYAVIKGSAVNNDGSDSGDLMAPSQKAQEAMILAACKDADVAPFEVDYVEAHGPGTPVGDPVEVGALGRVLGADRPVGRPLAVGSVKTNIGHLEAAAGIAGLIKVALSLRSGVIPASAHFRTPNPQIPFSELSVRVQSSNGPWPKTGRRPLAGVSSFGLTGTNAHVIVEGMPTSPAPTVDASGAPLLLPLSTRAPHALEGLARAHLELLSGEASMRPSLRQVCYATARRRTHHAHRLAVVTADEKELVEQLEGYLDGQDPSGVFEGTSASEHPPRLVFVFSGQGGQWPQMGRELAQVEPVFQDALASCDDAIRSVAGWSVCDAMAAAPEVSRIDQNDVMQPAIFATQVALAALWRSWGVEPAAVVGHSMGEVAAAHVAGVFDLDDAARLIVARSRLMQTTSGRGGMAVVDLSPEALERTVAGFDGRLTFAAFNSATSTVLSGDQDALDALAAGFEEEEHVNCRPVRTTVACHSHQMAPIVPALIKELGGLSLGEGSIPIYSTVTGSLKDGFGFDAGYWGRNLSEPVRFHQAMHQILEDGHNVLLEVSPHPLLWGPMLDTVQRSGHRVTVLASMRRRSPEVRSLLSSLGALYASGYTVDWSGLYPSGDPCIPLPRYPWQRKRFWFDSSRPVDHAPVAPPDGEPQQAEEETTENGLTRLQRRLEDAPLSRRPRLIRDYIRGQVAGVLGFGREHPLDTKSTFRDLGLSSLMAVELRSLLASALNRKLSATLLFKYSTIEKLAEHLSDGDAQSGGRLGQIIVDSGIVTSGEMQKALEAQTHSERPEKLGSVLVRLGLVTPAQLSKALKVQVNEPMAVVGMACRFPGADDLSAYWRLLDQGGSGIVEVPPGRWDWRALYDADPDAVGKMYTKWGGFVSGVDQFDPGFFRITPREAAAMDPQQRLLLEVVWEALEHAGHSAERLEGTRTGVFVGVMNYNNYANIKRLLDNPDLISAYDATGDATSIAAGRIAYHFGFHGPAIAMDTACSSSLVAAHLACQSLRAGECRMALVAGVNLVLSPEATIMFSKTRMMSPDGQCNTFDARANGYVRGEGCGVLVLKRLSDALADRDNVLALVRGSAINQDGRSSGITAPNELAQEEVIKQALASAGVEPSQVGYVEAHGTGTSLGDPIEVQALSAVYRKGRTENHRLAVGSVKTNIGHLEAAAGVAGVIKAVLSLQHEAIPPHLNLTKVNPHIDLGAAPLTVPTRLTQWPRGSVPRFAGVSAFGFSGTNVHVVLEEAPPRRVEPPAIDRSTHLLSLSGQDEAALQQRVLDLAEHLATNPCLSLADTCYTANAGRTHFAHRVALVASSVADLRAQLGAMDQRLDPGAHRAEEERVAFLFSGEGSWRQGTGQALYASQPTFRAMVDRCAEALEMEADRTRLLSVFSGEVGATDARQAVQLFVFQCALAELWQAWGIEPWAVMGFGVGECAAACVAKVFSLEDGLRVVSAQQRLFDEAAEPEKGVVIYAAEDVVAAAIESFRGRVSVAAVVAPECVIVSGDMAAVSDVAMKLEVEGIRCVGLAVERTSLSTMPAPAMEAYRSVVSRISYGAPKMILISGVTGERAERRFRTDRRHRGLGLVPAERRGSDRRQQQRSFVNISQPDYWVRRLREPILFARGMQTLDGLGIRAYLEVGPHPTLVGLGRQCIAGGETGWLYSLRRGRGEWEQLLTCLGQLYERGAKIDWDHFDRDYDRVRISLPTYPFQRRRCWIEGARSGPVGRAGRETRHPLLGQHVVASKVHVFETVLTSGDPSFLDEHRVHDMIVLPGTAYLEMAIAAAEEAFGRGRKRVTDVVFQEALTLDDGEERAVQVIISGEESDTADFQIVSRAASPGDGWVRHAAGKITSFGSGESPGGSTR
jgi:acyl transferase domain-containing protein